MNLNSVEEIIEDIRAGRMVIIMDDEDRENEGDFLLAASHCTAEHVNFMARYGRGLICLTLSEARCQQLNLPLMVQDTRYTHRTNFTMSIEAGEVVTGLLYANPDAIDMHDMQNTIAGPLNALSDAELVPGSAALETLNVALR
jgi:3,4-dihydroxy 2-butanone 4-phosphate synthase/GTP cyclohydrolase II